MVILGRPSTGKTFAGKSGSFFRAMYPRLEFGKIRRTAIVNGVKSQKTLRVVTNELLLIKKGL